jgi:hypothetical protein
MISGITGEQDGDDDEPDRPGKAPKPRKINSKISTTYGAKQALRWKINKQAFFEGYVDVFFGEIIKEGDHKGSSILK